MYKIPITPRIHQMMAVTLGQDFDASKYSVYEALANDSLPITGAGWIYKNATMSATFLAQMATSAKFGYVPMLELHREYSTLPVGRVFDAELYDNEQGSKDLHVLFYIMSSTDENSIDQKLQAGIISSVSSGTSPSKLCCSACGFEYTQNEKTLDRLFWDEECGNGHVIGQDAHVIMSELRGWDELSFVTQGAVPRAKILNSDKQKLSKKIDVLGLAASANIDKLRLSASTQKPDLGKRPDIKGDDMSGKIELDLARYESLVKLEGEKDNLKAELSTAQAAKVQLEADKTQLEKDKQQLEADLKAATDAKVQLEADKSTLENTKVELESKVTALTTQLATAGIPVDGVSEPANTPTSNNPDLDVSFFKRTK